MKILYISRGFPPYRGGTENYIYEIYKRLGRKHSLLLITRYHPLRKKQKNIIQINMPKVCSGTLSAILFMAKSFFYPFFLDYDLIHANTEIGGIVALPQIIRGKKLVTTIHDIGLIENSFLGSRIRKIMKKIVCKFSDKVITVSENAKSDLINTLKVDPRKIVVIPNGVNTKKFNPKIKEGFVKKRFNLSKKIIVLFVGMIAPKKGLEYLIEAAKEVKKKTKNVKFIIAGPFVVINYIKRLQRLVDRLNLRDEIFFTGYIPQGEIQFWYKDCDIFVAPSIGGEGFGLTCLEASATGKPIIATEIFEKIGVVKNNYNGLIVPTKSSIAIANAILKLIKNKKLRERLGENGINLSKIFSWKKAAEMTNKVYYTLESEK